MSNRFFTVGSGVRVNGSKLYIIHLFHVKPKWVLKLLWNLGTFKRKFPPLLRVTAVRMLTPIPLLFNVYLMLLEDQRFTIIVYMCVCVCVFELLRRIILATHLKQ